MKHFIFASVDAKYCCDTVRHSERFTIVPIDKLNLPIFLKMVAVSSVKMFYIVERVEQEESWL